MTHRRLQDDPEYRSVLRQFRIAAGVSLIVVAGGMVFYHITENFSWVNAIYFCVITLTTVGYGDIVPKTDAGKIFTVFYVLIGVGIIATFINLTVKRAVIRRQLRDRLTKH